MAKNRVATQPVVKTAVRLIRIPDPALGLHRAADGVHLVDHLRRFIEHNGPIAQIERVAEINLNDNEEEEPLFSIVLTNQTFPTEILVDHLLSHTFVIDTDEAVGRRSAAREIKRMEERFAAAHA